jgi:thiamine pyrophosphate-dependent acetolactate synthase large subunit-like protein
LQFPEANMERAAAVVQTFQRPVLLAGGGAVAARAADELRTLAQRLDAPVLTTLNGKGILDERDPLSLGHARSVRGRAILDHADGMLAIGCRFTEVMTGFRTLKIPPRLVQVDIDAGQIGVNHPVEIGVVADARVALSTLVSRIPSGRKSAWGTIWESARMTQPARAEWLIHTLRAELPEDAVVFTDFVMTAQELATAVRYQLHVIAVIHNDATYGAIKNIQKNRHDGRFVDTDLNNPDFLKLAAAYEVPAVRAPNAGSFAQALREALERRGPSLIEVPDEWRYLRG